MITQIVVHVLFEIISSLDYSDFVHIKDYVQVHCFVTGGPNPQYHIGVIITFGK